MLFKSVVVIILQYIVYQIHTLYTSNLCNVVRQYFNKSWEKFLFYMPCPSRWKKKKSPIPMDAILLQETLAPFLLVLHLLVSLNYFPEHYMLRSSFKQGLRLDIVIFHSPYVSPSSTIIFSFVNILLLPCPFLFLSHYHVHQ